MKIAGTCCQARADSKTFIAKSVTKKKEMCKKEAGQKKRRGVQ